MKPNEFDEIIEAYKAKIRRLESDNFLLKTKVEAFEYSRIEFLTIDDVVDITKISRSTILRMEDCGEFPPRVVIRGRRRFWVRKQINEWLENLLSIAVKKRDSK